MASRLPVNLVHAARSMTLHCSHAHPISLIAQRCISRTYATYKDVPRSSGLSRKRVTVTSDDGHLRWSELSGREKTARATQQTINFTIIIAGALLTGTVFTLLYKDVFAPDSKTVYFNKVVDRIKEDPRCIKLLGDAKNIRAYGENVDSKWTRNRPIATTIEKDSLGRDHMKMRFYVTGPINEGTVVVHLIRDLDTAEYKYWLLALDCKGQQRLYLENEEAKQSAVRRAGTRIFGIQWR
ncbi:mitochondrial import inner membrane translocase subunit tim21 [Ascosphaera aggregata]|nr:mitochondrial import inner membrane translocase subunit tim21 [Ascosphaera aggregata]